MKGIISIAIIAEYPQLAPESFDGLIRGLRAEMVAHARAYGLTDIEVAVNTWKTDETRNPAITWERPA